MSNTIVRYRHDADAPIKIATNDELRAHSSDDRRFSYAICQVDSWLDGWCEVERAGKIVYAWPRRRAIELGCQWVAPIPEAVIARMKQIPYDLGREAVEDVSQ